MVVPDRAAGRCAGIDDAAAALSSSVGRGTARTTGTAAVLLAAAHPVLAALALAALVVVAATGAWQLLAAPVAWVVFGVVGSLVQPDTLPGRPVRPAEEPELAALLHDVAGQAGFRAPLSVRVVPDVEAALGPVRWRGTTAYVLLLGWPLLQGLAEDELTAVVAHELAHHRHARDRATRWLLSAREQLADSRADRVRVHHALADRLLLATRDDAWGPELAADQDSVRIAGADAAGRALVRTDLLRAAFALLADPWLDVLGEREQRPLDLYEAVSEALTDPYVVAGLRRALDDEALLSTTGDSHPPTATRLASVGRPAPELPLVRPLALRTGEEVRAWCTGQLVDPDATPVRLLDLPPEQRERPAAEAAAALAEATGAPDGGTALLRTLDAVDDGAWHQVALRLEPELRSAPPDVRELASRDVLAGCAAAVLWQVLVGGGWKRASSWRAGVLRSADGRTALTRDLLEDAITREDTQQVRGLVAEARREVA
ncbi:MAG: hypothetical protein JWN17_1450 [Frankiales bacterium]|nr:hypothetical protein [Frankiales bacterium]